MKYVDRWIVILIGPRGQPMPMGDGDGPTLFLTEKEAMSCAQRNMLGAAFGYEVYLWPHLHEDKA